MKPRTALTTVIALLLLVLPYTSAFGQPLSNTFLNGSFKSVNATLRAIERAGVLRTLAEPSLTAISGESANFLVGGEFPVFGGVTCDSLGHNCQTTVLWKKWSVPWRYIAIFPLSPP